MATSNLILSICGLIAWSLWAMLYKRKLLWAIAPITVFLHAIVFYVVLLSISAPDLPPETKQFLNAWSNGLRFHTLTILTGMGTGLAWGQVKRWITRRTLLRR